MDGFSIDDPIIWVRRHPHDWRLAAYRLSDLGDLEEDRDSKSRLSASVWCHPPEDGERLHVCRPNAAPHRLRVAVMKKDNEPIFERLVAAARAGAFGLQGYDAALSDLRTRPAPRRASATAPA